VVNFSLFFNGSPINKWALGSFSGQSNRCTFLSSEAAKLLAMACLPTPPFLLAIQIIIIGPPVPCGPRTLDILLRGKDFQARGELGPRSLGIRNIPRGLQQSHHADHARCRLVPCLYLSQGPDLLGRFRLLVASYSPPYFGLKPIYFSRIHRPL
jgi:hypothetical protein